MHDDQHNRARDLRQRMTEAEAFVWSQLRNRRFHQFKFRRQFPVGRFVTDFACPERFLVVELDGGQHTLQRNYDDASTKKLERSGYRVVRFWNHDVLTDWDTVAEVIWNALQ